MHLTSVYAAILALFFVGLSVRTIKLRRKGQIAVGDIGHPELQRAARVHANFAEYVPLALLLIFMVEMRGAATYWVDALALCLLIGRISHAYGVSQINEVFKYRVFGMAMTFTCLITSALYLLVA